MQCEICNKKDGGYQCKDCKRVICEDCVKYTKEGVMCKDCLKEIKEKPKVSGGSKALKSTLIMLVILTIGLGSILYIGLQFIEGLDQGLDLLNIPLEGLKNASYIIIGGMGALTLLIAILYLISRRAKSI